MELPKISGGGVLDGLRGRFGRANRRVDDDFVDERAYGDYEQGYDDYAEEDRGYSSRPSGFGSGSSVSQGSDSRGYGDDYEDASYHDPHYAPLVSLDDVRASTRRSSSFSNDAPSSSSRQNSRSSYSAPSSGIVQPTGRVLERASDYTISRPAEIANDYAPSSRGEGVDSLFSSTASAGGRNGYDPYDAYEGSGRASYSSTRNLNVMKPLAYTEVERVAKSLKSGDAVILNLRNTPDQLAKRILDFSFGVSSALDAGVDCIADKVFAITRGSALSEAEKLYLQRQGVL